VEDNWNDYGFVTTFDLTLFDRFGGVHRIGNVKIGQTGLSEGKPAIPPEFEGLAAEFFSLGQDDSYYTSLSDLGDRARDEVLFALHDLAKEVDSFELLQSEEVVVKSLLRSVSKSTVLGQFVRIISGGKRLSQYRFSYSLPSSNTTGRTKLRFEVQPESHPPTNLHVVIGRNGAGKTRTLYNMARALVDNASPPSQVGEFDWDETGSSDSFASVVSVSFSAFESFEPIPERTVAIDSGISYSYIGLRHQYEFAEHEIDDIRTRAKDANYLAVEFASSLRNCKQGARESRWRKAVETLESDPGFKDAEVAVLANEQSTERDAIATFSSLSSGHKIVLLTLTRLVEAVEERTLVLLDEPETHLHPPLLSASIRALADLLIERNGVAIIATHSPVVLQEVPQTCVWKIARSGEFVSVARPALETFGENVGILTREVFGLEVTSAGFHKMLEESVSRSNSLDEVLSEYNRQLGDEAIAIAQALLIAKQNEEI